MNEVKSHSSDTVNVSAYLTRMAYTEPYRRAVVCPVGRDSSHRVAYSHLTFMQLEKEVDRLAYGLREAGIRRGTRTVLMVRPSIEFFALIFAIFKTGAVPVVVDPGMGIRRMLSCYRSTRPRAFIGIPLAHAVRTLCPKFFDTVKIWITVGRRWFWCILASLLSIQFFPGVKKLLAASNPRLIVRVAISASGMSPCCSASVPISQSRWADLFT